jgi:transcriptional regulator with XRE-family HTH domain
MEDQRVGSALRALRLRRGLRQADVAAAADIPRGAVMRIEAGRLDEVSFGHVRRLARVLDARFEGLLRWRGADLDRLVNRGHALMHEAAFRWLKEIGGWLALPEVSFVRNGERGVIDIVAWHAAARMMLVIELKTRIVDINDLMATMDVRRRVAWQIAKDQGWDPVAVGVWVVVAPARSNARALADHATVLRAKFPADGRSMRRWLSKPVGDIAGLSFMPQVRVKDLGRDPTTPRRVRRSSPSINRQQRPGPGRREPRIGVTFGA